MSDTTFRLPQRAPIRLLDQELKLDPSIKEMQAEIQLQLMARRNPLDWVLPWQHFLPRPPAPGTSPNPFSFPVPPPLPSLWKFQPGAGPQTARAGTGGDILNAILQLPVSQALMKQLTHKLTRQAHEFGTVWDRTNVGGRIALVTVGAVLAGASVAAIIGNQETRQFAFDAIKGRTIPIPMPASQKFGLGVKGLQLSASVRIAATSFSVDAYNLSLSLDVLKLLAK